MATVSELLTRIHEKAEQLNIDLEMDDEDIQIFALQRLLDNFEDVFVKVEEENSTIQILGWNVEYWWHDDFDCEIEEDDYFYEEIKNLLKDGYVEGELVFDEFEDSGEFIIHRGYWKKIK